MSVLLKQQGTKHPNRFRPVFREVIFFQISEQVEVLFKGVLSEGCEISYLGKSLLLEDKKTWETKIKVKGDPKAITFEFTDARGNKSEIRFFSHGKIIHPHFISKLKKPARPEQKAIRKALIRTL